MNGVGQLVLTSLWDDDSNELSGVRVERADPLILIAPELWDLAVAGDLAFTDAGEGVAAIHTVNAGTVRYALTGAVDHYGNHYARRLSAPLNLTATGT